jgi:Beta-lactamase
LPTFSTWGSGIRRAPYSTVLDLYKRDRAFYPTKVLSAQSLVAAFTPHQYVWAEGIKYGYGWGIAQVHGHRVVGHGGGISGFSTVLWRAIEENATSVVLSNHYTSVSPTFRRTWSSPKEVLVGPWRTR